MAVGQAGVSLAQNASGSGGTLSRSQFNCYAAEQYSYDDNLYRLPDNFNVAALGNLSRQDHMNTVSAGGDYQWVGGRQVVSAAVRLDDNRFVRSDVLNNTSGNGKLAWDWQASPRLSGTAGGDFSRSLAGFANTFFFAKDLVDTVDYFASARLRIAQRWTVTAGLKEADTTHSAPERQDDEFRSKAGSLGLEYLTSQNDSLGFNYSYTDGRFPQLGSFDGLTFDRSYKDSLEQFVVKYMLTGKTELDAKAGYQERRYPHADFGAFSGDTWRVSLKSQITGKIQLGVSGWRELTAYLDAESDYFVSKGVSTSMAWSMTNKLSLSLSASYSDQNYISTSPSTILFDTRHDKLRSQQAALLYAPRHWLNVQISYRHDDRDSNRFQFGYGDHVATGQVMFRL